MRGDLRFAVGSFGVLVTLAACGGGGSSGSGGGTTYTTTTATKSTTTTANPDIGLSFDTAEEVEIGSPVTGDLGTPAAPYYYKFQGQKGQLLQITTLAQTSAKPFDPAVIDSVVTLYDDTRTAIAENADPTPYTSTDASLFTVLPKDGTYYVLVQDCFTWTNLPSRYCTGSVERGVSMFTFGVLPVEANQAGRVKDKEPNDGASSAQALTYQKGPKSYYLTVSWGDFGSASDVDVFSFKIPSDYLPASSSGRAMLQMWFNKPGPKASGATTSAGNIYLTTADAPGVKLASFAGTDFDNGTRAPLFAPPLDVSKTYLLFIEHPAGALGENPFYVGMHGAGLSNPLELKDAENGDPTKAETAAFDAGGLAYAEGDLADADVDYWALDLTGKPTTSRLQTYCTGQRSGSGVRGMKVEVLKGDATALSPAITTTESAGADALTGLVPINGTKMLVKVTKASQAADVTGTFYRCVFFVR